MQHPKMWATVSSAAPTRRSMEALKRSGTTCLKVLIRERLGHRDDTECGIRNTLEILVNEICRVSAIECDASSSSLQSAFDNVVLLSKAVSAPELCYLRIEICEHNPLCDLLQNIRAPCLATVNLSCTTFSYDFFDLWKGPSLRHLSLHSSDIPIYELQEHLLALPHLEEFNLIECRLSGGDTAAGQPKAILLPKLRSLHLCITPSDMSNLLKRLEPPVLSIVSLFLWVDGEIDDTSVETLRDDDADTDLLYNLVVNLYAAVLRRRRCQKMIVESDLSFYESDEHDYRNDRAIVHLRLDVNLERVGSLHFMWRVAAALIGDGKAAAAVSRLDLAVPVVIHSSKGICWSIVRHLPTSISRVAFADKESDLLTDLFTIISQAGGDDALLPAVNSINLDCISDALRAYAVLSISHFVRRLNADAVQDIIFDITVKVLERCDEHTKSCEWENGWVQQLDDDDSHMGWEMYSETPEDANDAKEPFRPDLSALRHPGVPGVQMNIHEGEDGK